MKVIFLDMDGVINRGGEFGEEGRLNAQLMQVFKAMLPKTGASVVISSTWRYHTGALDVIRQNLCDVYDITPLDETGAAGGVGRRGIEIQNWLNVRPDIERYAIIDDSPHMLEAQLPNFFKTEGNIGITEDIASKVIHHFA